MRMAVSRRALSAATAAILGLTTVQVVDTPLAAAETRMVAGTDTEYNDQDPASVPWGGQVKQDPAERYGNLHVSLDAVNTAGVAKTGTYDRWGAPVALRIWDSANRTNYKRLFSAVDRPDPFRGSNSIATRLGTWSYTSNSSQFSVTWEPAPGYIGYAPPLPIQIDPFAPGGWPPAKYHYVTTGLPGRATTPLESSGAFGATQTARASDGFDGVRKGMGWLDFQPTYAFQVDRGDAIAGKVAGTLDYVTDGDGNYLGHVTTELTTSEGTYTINPETGEVSFTPSATFFSLEELDDVDVTSKSAAPIRVVVDNLTTNKDLGNGRVMPYGETRPAHTIDANDASRGEVVTEFRPSVDKPKVALKATATQAQAGRTAQLAPNFAQETGEAAIDPATLLLIDARNHTTKQTSIPGEGTWTVHNDGTVTFAPEPGFVGNPTPIRYTASNERGVPGGSATLTVEYEVPDGAAATSVGKQGKTQTSGSRGARHMFPGYPDAWYDGFTFGLVAPNGELVREDIALEIPAVGQYSIDKATGEVTFTPLPSFAGEAPRVGVRITNLTTANGQKLPTDATYSPEVLAVAVRAADASDTKNPGEQLTAAPKHSKDIETASIQIDGADTGSNSRVKTIPNQGVWSVADNGVFTFTPIDGFYGTPEPVEYTVANTDGVRSVEPGTVSGTYRAPKTSPSVSTGDAGQPQTSKPGADMFPSFPDDWTITYSLAGAIDNALTTDEGTYSIDASTGVVTFTPAEGYRGTASAVTVEAITATGAKETTTFQVSVTGRMTVTETATATEIVGVPTTITTQVPTTVVNATTVQGTPVTVTETASVPTTVTTTAPAVPTTITAAVPTTVTETAVVDGTPTTVITTVTVPTTVTTAVPTTTTATATATTTAPAVPTTITTAVPTTVTETAVVDGTPTTVITTETVPTTVTTAVPTTATATTIATTTAPAVPTTITTAVPTTVTETAVVAGTPTTIITTETVPTTVTTTEAVTETVSAAQFNLPDIERTATQHGNVTFSPRYPKNVDTNTVRFLDGDGNPVNVLIVPGQGTWKVGDTGAMSFTPEQGFGGNPTPVSYIAANKSGVNAAEPATVTVKYQLPATETATATETETTTVNTTLESRTTVTSTTAVPTTVTSQATVTTVVPTTVSGAPTTVTTTEVVPTTVTTSRVAIYTTVVRPDPITETVYPNPATETIYMAPITVTPDPVTTTVAAIKEPTPVGIDVPALTVIPNPVITTVNGAAVTVTHAPITTTPPQATVTVTSATRGATVTATPDPVTVVPEPITSTFTPAPVTTTVDGNVIRAYNAKVEFKGKPNQPFVMEIADAKMDPETLRFKQITGSQILRDGKELVIPNQGKWEIKEALGKEPQVVFTPVKDLGGTLAPVDFSYKRKGEAGELPVKIGGYYPMAGNDPLASKPTTVATPTTVVTPKSPGNAQDAQSDPAASPEEVMRRMVGNAVRSPIAWMLPIGALVAGVGQLAAPVLGGFQNQLTAMNEEISRRARAGGPNSAIAARIAAANRQLEILARDPMARTRSGRPRPRLGTRASDERWGW